jgi:hypothetical protein
VNSKFYGKLDLTSNATQPAQNFIQLPCNSGFKIKNISLNNINNIDSSILSTYRNVTAQAVLQNYDSLFIIYD